MEISLSRFCISGRVFESRILWAEHETADVADQRALLNQLSCRLGALAAAVAELPQVFSESVAGLVEAHESMRGEIQMMRAQWRDERAASREAVAILRALIDDASDSARVTALTARVQALEAASAAGIRPSSPSAARRSRRQLHCRRSWRR